MKFRNLTPHAIDVYAGDKSTTFPPDPAGPARVSVTREEGFPEGEFPTFVVVPGEITGLPEYEVGTVLVVSMVVLEAAPPGRFDIVAPGN